MANKNYRYLLLEACEAGNVQKVLDMLKEIGREIDLNCRDKNGDTPLIIAAGNGHHELGRSSPGRI
ncbi:MAG: ankyrin repeat domain-containing protein [Deltaproteobacteria bacterium]|nr:ankyrin repeat domain-containing protein [Deltaproteobacteria bacterium]